MIHNILLAPDSFKDSLCAQQFCQIAQAAIARKNPRLNVQLLPMADGGEGTLEAFLNLLPGKKTACAVHDPLGRIITAHYAQVYYQGKKTAIIEMAQASGLPLLTPAERDPLKTSSIGTGELIKDALDQGCQQLIIGLGGSATNDAGMGLLQALGVRFMDHKQQLLPACGEHLRQIASIDPTHLDPRLLSCNILIAADVTHPLLGKQGATYVFAPQKGANNAVMLEQLELGVQHFAHLTQTLLPHADPNQAGAGAAGGLGFCLMSYAHARIQSGFEWIAQISQLDRLLSRAKHRPDWIITGEGRFDPQSLQGKVVGHLIQKSQTHQIPLTIICGSYEPAMAKWALTHSIELIALNNPALSLADNLAQTPEQLRNTVQQLLLKRQHSLQDKIS